jgi:hypothetical protein
MAFEAYEPSVVVDEFARKIESLCVWGDTLIAGLSDGSLLFFQEQQQGSEQGSGRVLSSWQVTRVQKNFGKRGVQQLQALENKPYLLSLSGEQQRASNRTAGSLQEKQQEQEQQEQQQQHT